MLEAVILFYVVCGLLILGFFAAIAFPIRALKFVLICIGLYYFSQLFGEATPYLLLVALLGYPLFEGFREGMK
jgi:hypothetical protein